MPSEDPSHPDRLFSPGGAHQEVESLVSPGPREHQDDDGKHQEVTYPPGSLRPRAAGELQDADQGEHEEVVSSGPPRLRNMGGLQDSDHGVHQEVVVSNSLRPQDEGELQDTDQGAHQKVVSICSPKPRSSEESHNTENTLQDAVPDETSELLEPPPYQVTTEERKKENFEITENFDFSKLSLREKMGFIYDNITVEPMLALYIVSSVLSSLATQNLNLEKACRVNLGYSDEVCDALSIRDTANYTFEEGEVQQLTAGMAGLKSFLQASIPSFIVLFVGSWSDRHGCRKPCMLIPIVGEFLTSVGFIVCTYFFYELPVEAAVLTEAMFPALCGGWVTMFMAIFSYMADVTSEENRTLRIGIVNVFYSLGIPLGQALSGVLYKQIGFYGVFSLSSFLYVISFWYGYTYIKEEPKKIPADKAGRGLIAFLKDFFDVRSLAETFQVAFKSGENNRRIRVIFILIGVMLIIGPMSGEYVVMYLFTRLRFNWDEIQFSVFLTYGMVVNLIGTTISVGLLSHMLEVDDAIIGILSCMSKILAGFVYAFATTTWMIYLAPIVDMVNGTSFIAMRSITSKLVPSDELGKVNSLFGACEGLMPLLFGPMYSLIYQATMYTLPGAFYLVGGAITGPAVLIFACLYRFSKQEQKRKQEQLAE